MLIRKYTDFLDIRSNETEPIKENLQTAKLFLRKKVLDEYKKKDPELKLTVTDLDNIERDPGNTPELQRAKMAARRIKQEADNNEAFQEVKALLLAENSPNFGYLFTRFAVDEGLSIDSMKTLLKSLKEFSQYLNRLPMAVDKYAGIVPSEKDKRKGSERLVDDIEKLRELRAVDRFVKELPGQFVVTSEHVPDTGATVPSIKDAYQNAPQPIKDKVARIALAFDMFGSKENEDGEKVFDPVKNKMFRDQFWSWVRFWARSLNDIILTAQKHLAGALANESEYLKLIEQANKRFGEVNGCSIVSFTGGVLVTHVKSFQANKFLNDDTLHCIVKYLGNWESYVSAKGNYNMQYYIRNFNLGPEDPLSVIGITIGPNQEITAAFNKSNSSIGGSVKRHISDLGLDFKSVFKPMTKEQQIMKKKTDEASEIIVKSDITLDKMKECIEYGANPNAQNGLPLQNAVATRDMEKIKYLLEQGAMATIGNPLDRLTERESPESLEIAKLLVTKGARAKGIIVEMLVSDYGILKEILDNGFNVNVEEGQVVRRLLSITENKKISMENAIKTLKLLLEYGLDVETKNWHALKTAGENGFLEMLKMIVDHAKKKSMSPTERQLKSIISWIKGSDEIDAKTMKAQIEYITKAFETI
jgi:hypothetical protein